MKKNLPSILALAAAIIGIVVFVVGTMQYGSTPTAAVSVETAIR